MPLQIGPLQLYFDKDKSAPPAISWYAGVLIHNFDRKSFYLFDNNAIVAGMINPDPGVDIVQELQQKAQVYAEIPSDPTHLPLAERHVVLWANQARSGDTPERPTYIGLCKPVPGRLFALGLWAGQDRFGAPKLEGGLYPADAFAALATLSDRPVSPHQARRKRPTNSSNPVNSEA